MAKTIVVKPLGLVLRKAGLVSYQQVEKALEDSSDLPKCKLGEILAIRGWIKPETADFFAEVWPSLFTKTVTKKRATSIFQPLGQYLKAASLISEQQINQILKIQQTKSIKFGKIAVEKNIISQATLDFFLEHLNLIKTEPIIDICSETLALECDRIENYLLNNQKCEPLELLQRYELIKQRKKTAAAQDLVEQELLASGIIARNNNAVYVSKPFYEDKFDEDWLEKELAHLQPYNQIRLEMFDLDHKVGIPHKIINLVNYWTDHEPHLTQRVYQLIKEKASYIAPGEEELVIESLIYQYIINDWQNGAAAKHLQKISDRFTQNYSNSKQTLLNTYKKIYQLKQVSANHSWAQSELMRIGLIKLEQNQVTISNRIYQSVFDLPWIQENLQQIKPQVKSHHSFSQQPLPSVKATGASDDDFLFKNKYVFRIVLILIILNNCYFIIKTIQSSSRNQETIEQNINQ